MPHLWEFHHARKQHLRSHIQPIMSKNLGNVQQSGLTFASQSNLFEHALILVSRAQIPLIQTLTPVESTPFVSHA